MRFGVGGSEYEIDLSEKNAAKLRKQLAPFVEHARRASGQARRPVRTAASRRRSRDIRAWAQAQGIQLSERGRIPAGIAAQYEAEAGRGSRRLARVRARTRPGPCPRHADISFRTPVPGSGRLAGARCHSEPSSQPSCSSVAVILAASRSCPASVPAGRAAARVAAAAAVCGRAPSAARSW